VHEVALESAPILKLDITELDRLNLGAVIGSEDYATLPESFGDADLVTHADHRRPSSPGASLTGSSGPSAKSSPGPLAFQPGLDFRDLDQRCDSLSSGISLQERGPQPPKSPPVWAATS
jgi:hypothetical protein